MIWENAMKLPRREFLHLVAGAAALPAFANPCAAQDWPTRPLTIVVPFAAGGSFDVLARVIAPGLSEHLGQQVIVENITGAGGMVGASRVAKAPPDGYQILMGDSGIAQSQALYKTPLYNAVTDLTPVALIATQPPLLTVRRDLPADNLQEFISYAKANQTRMQYGSAGVGSPNHLACVLVNTAIGVDVTHVPYRGAAPGMQDLIAGRIDYFCPIAAGAIPQIESKSIKAIAILTKSRSPSLPTLASAHEQGLPDLEAGAWNALFLPKGTAAAIVQRLHAATVATMANPALAQRLKEIAATVVAPEQSSSAYLAKFIMSEIEKWGKVVRAGNIKVE
jgi:tripartite-type tricarboxylate transporter receptor subunit TctC